MEGLFRFMGTNKGQHRNQEKRERGMRFTRCDIDFTLYVKPECIEEVTHW